MVSQSIEKDMHMLTVQRSRQSARRPSASRKAASPTSRRAPRKPSMSSKHSRVHHHSLSTSNLSLIPLVIARQALAQEDVGDFGNEFPETIPIDLKGNDSGCAC